MKRLLFIFIFSAALFSPIFYVQATAPIKILLVPGHDNQSPGAQYGNIKEADMTLALATRIYNILKKDSRFEVHITRNSSGYTKEFADYLSGEQAEISAFEENAKIEMQNKISNGSFIQKENPPHNTVTEDIATRLYGFNKWADENKMDAVIHIHFNDYPRPTKWTIGQYKGFVVYLPEQQMANSEASDLLATNIYLQFRKKYSTSTFEKELGGFIPDQSLIALGSNGTLLPSVCSVLVEYGYIYEKKFRTNSARTASYIDMANLTVQGIKNNFSPIP
jgi:N-acetylmuramoyl-L-alanine amidase